MSPRPVREYQFSNFSVRPESLSLRCRGEERRLQPASFAALVYLIEHRDRIVTQAELIAAVSPQAALSGDALAACVAEIRAALNDSADPPIVSQLPDAGYRFSAAITEVPPPATRRRPWLLPLGVLACLAPACWLAWWFWPVDIHEVGWWRFAGSSPAVEDSSGRENTGRIHGDAQRIAEGPAGHALRLSGNAHVSGESAGVGFPQKDGSFTITAWVRPRAGAPAGTIFQFGSRGGPRSNARLYLADSGAACLALGQAGDSACSARSLADGGWHYLAGSYDARAGVLVLYVDGAESARRSSAGPADLATGTPWTIGAAPAYSGDLADVRLFDGALSHPRIAALDECTLSNLTRLPGSGQAYAVPLFRTAMARLPAPETGGGALAYAGPGNAGLEFGYSEGACSLASLEGVALQEDLRIGVDLLLPPQTAAGPFFHARRVAPGDSIQAPGSGGVWVRLDAGGKITVEALAHRENSPVEPLATGLAPQPANSSGWRHLEAEMRGGKMRVWVDGVAVRLSPPGAAAGEVIPIATKIETADGIAVRAPAHPTGAILVRNITVRDPAQ